jgi:hypothetical protein
LKGKLRRWFLRLLKMITVVNEKLKQWLNSVVHDQGDHSQCHPHRSTANAALLVLSDDDAEAVAAQDEMDGETAWNRFIGSQGNRRTITGPRKAAIERWRFSDGSHSSQMRDTHRISCGDKRSPDKHHAWNHDTVVRKFPFTQGGIGDQRRRMQGFVVCPSRSSRP